MILLEQKKTQVKSQQKELDGKQLKHTAQQNSDLQTETETLKTLVSSQKTEFGKCTSASSLMSVPLAELRLVLLGRSGCGKRAAGNTILDREERSQGKVAGRHVTVVDILDWFCPGLSLEELSQGVGLGVHLSTPGPYAFILVIPVEESTGEESEMLVKMEEIYGEKCWRNSLVLFTVIDEVHEKIIEEFIQSATTEQTRQLDTQSKLFFLSPD
ncbi:hypothetical protein MHYP_G00277440 [Metynnis hypsauchen]